MNRVLILGVTGMLGHKIAQTLGDLDVVGTARRPDANVPGLNSERVITDVSAEDLDRVSEVVRAVEPNVVVNCVGIVKQLPAAKEALGSIQLNALLPHHLNALAEERGARLIHFSTDCVFSGTSGPYAEDDPADPPDLYGRSKLLGEVGGTKALTLRTSIVGRELAGSASLVEWFLSQAGRTVNGFRQAFYSGITTLEMAYLVRRLISTHSELSGVYHVASEPIDKYRLLCLLRDAFEIDVEIIPVDEPRVDRSLISDRFTAATGWVAPT